MSEGNPYNALCPVCREPQASTERHPGPDAKCTCKNGHEFRRGDAIPVPKPKGLNPGIHKFVTLLQEAGFRTTDSGDGETHEFGCDRPQGYVAMLVPPEKLVSECDRLLGLVTSLGICVEPVSPANHPSIQGTYDPSNKVGVIDLQNVHDRQLP